jgi:hypothetical protein
MVCPLELLQRRKERKGESSTTAEFIGSERGHHVAANVSFKRAPSTQQKNTEYRSLSADLDKEQSIPWIQFKSSKLKERPSNVNTTKEKKH